MFEKKIMQEFNDGTKRINIDYKNIREYEEPFIMTLEVKGKRKLDVWRVRNGRHADDIRKEYKKMGRETSYVDFYKTVEDLISEQNTDGLQFNPRIRGKRNKGAENAEIIDTRIDLGQLYEILQSSLKTHENIEEYVKEIVKEKLTEVLSEFLKNIKNS